MRRTPPFLLLFLVLAHPSQAEEMAAPALFPLLSPWSINGTWSNTVEEYALFGNHSSAPYRNPGVQYYSELSATALQQVSDYEKLSGRVSGVVSLSDYRSPYRGVVPEQFTLGWERGDARVPFRLEAGDAYASFSPRTLQTSLKGASLELQPDFGGAGKNSFVLVSGFRGGVYRGPEMNPGDDSYAGLSWVYEGAENSAYGLNGAYNHRERSFTKGQPETDQGVVSATGSREFPVGEHTLAVEGEIAGMYGSLADGLQAEQDRADIGSFVSVEGITRAPLSYSAAFERYGHDFAPAGGSAPRDQSETRGNLGWRFDDGLRLGARFVRTETALTTLNPTKNYTGGLRLSGPLLNDILTGLNASLDAAVTDSANETRSTSARQYVASADFNMPLDDDWNARLSFRGRHVKDRQASSVTQGREAGIGLDHRLDFGVVTGLISPAFSWNTDFGNGNTTTEYGPSLGASLNYGEHSVSLNHRMAYAEQVSSGSLTDVMTNNISAYYNWSHEVHNLRFSGDMYDREPFRPVGIQAYRFALTYTLSFDKPAGKTVAGGLPAADAAAMTELETAFAPLAVAMGSSTTEVENELVRLNLPKGSRIGDVLVVEAQALARMDARQRYFFLFKNRRLVKTALVIDVDQALSGRALERFYADARGEAIRYYGAPAVSYESDAVTDNWPDDLKNNALRRFVEWDVPQGKIRLGLPRRLDGVARFEIQSAASLPAPEQRSWSISEIVK